jgi:hypothetical protein
MPEMKLGLDLVVVPPSRPLALHVTLVHEVGQDLVGAALRDAHRLGDVAQPDAGVVSDA